MSEPMKTPPLAAEAGEEKAMLKAQRDLWIERASLWQHEANERGEELAAKRAALLRAEQELEQVKAERDRMREFVMRFCDFYPDCAQLLDGWHQDGTAWSEWDESVRQHLTQLGKAAEAALGEKGSKS